MTGKLQVIASRFKSPEFSEPTGIVGGGDALALRELTAFFNKIGFKKFETLYIDERHLDRRANLVLLGGIDTNQVTTDALELIKPNVRIVDPGPQIKVEIHDLAPEPCPEQSSIEAGTPRKYQANDKIEYGIIIRARNPFEPSKAIIIIAGTYGYGTWGAVDLIQQESFLRRCEQLDLAGSNSSTPARRSPISFMRRTRRLRYWSPLECIFEVKIFDNRPYAPEIIIFRPLL